MSAFDFEDSPAPRTPRRREAGHGAGAFRTMLGGSLGCVAAVVLSFALLAVGCAGCVIVGALNSKPEPTAPAEPAPKKK